jgi:hypothetical protein
VVKVAAGGCKRPAASLQRTASNDQLRLFDKSAESSAKEVSQRKTQKEVKISKSETARKSIRSKSVWNAAESLKARGTFRNF